MNIDSEDFIIWRDSKTYMPICSITEMEDSTNVHSMKISRIDIFIEGDEQLREMLKEAKLDSSWLYKKQLFLPANREQDFKNFFSRHGIQNKQFFYKLIAIINNEVFERVLMNSVSKEMIRELRYYENYETPLREALEEYQKNYSIGYSTQSPEAKGQITSISFKFSHDKKSFKVERQSVLTSIMNCLLIHYRFSESVNFNLVSSFQKNMIETLFDYFRKQNNYYYSKTKNGAITLIEEIFSLADYEYNSDAITKTLQRLDKY